MRPMKGIIAIACLLVGVLVLSFAALAPTQRGAGLSARDKRMISVDWKKRDTYYVYTFDRRLCEVRCFSACICLCRCYGLLGIPFPLAAKLTTKAFSLKPNSK